MLTLMYNKEYFGYLVGKKRFWKFSKVKLQQISNLVGTIVNEINATYMSVKK